MTQVTETASIGGMDSAEPELCRVSVIGGNTQLDVGLPASVPVAAFIGDVVELIESRNPDLTEDDEGGPLRTQHWSLARIGKDVIPPDQTLTEAEVFDGELLVLRAVAAKESPALFDDVIDAVAKLTADTFGGWSSTAARWTGLITAVLAVVAALGLLAAGKQAGSGLAAAFTGAGVGLVMFGAAILVSRKYGIEQVTVVLSLCAILLIGGGAALFVPDGLGSPHALLGCAVTGVVAVVAYRVTGVGAAVFAAVIMLSLFGSGAALTRMLAEPDMVKIAAGVVVIAILMLSWAPRLAFGMARLPVPPVPTAGAAIDPHDHEQRPTIEGIGAIGATALPSAAGLGLRARTANQYQSGMIIGCSVAAAAGALVAASPGRWQGVSLAVVVSVILCLRGRSFADITQAGAMIISGAATFGLLLVGMAFSGPDQIIALAGLMLAFAAAVVFFGVVGPTIEISPVTRRAGEIFEYLLICTIIPLVFWIIDLYGTARNI